MDVTGGRGVDLITVMLANVNLAKDLTMLAPAGGRVVVIGNRGTIEINPRDAMAREGSILGLTLFAATDARCRAVEQTEKGTATFGSTAVFNVPTWKVMQQLAATQVTDGKWEKIGDGYVLHGKAKEFGMVAESPEVAWY